MVGVPFTYGPRTARGQNKQNSSISKIAATLFNCQSLNNSNIVYLLHLYAWKIVVMRTAKILGKPVYAYYLHFTLGVLSIRFPTTIKSLEA